VEIDGDWWRLVEIGGDWWRFIVIDGNPFNKFSLKK